MNHCVCYLAGAREIWLVQKILISERDGCLRQEGGEGGRTGDGDSKTARLCPPTRGRGARGWAIFRARPAQSRAGGTGKASQTVSAAIVANWGEKETKRRAAISTALTTAPPNQPAGGAALEGVRSRWVRNTLTELAGTLATTPKFQLAFRRAWSPRDGLFRFVFVDYPTPSHALSPGPQSRTRKSEYGVFSAQAKIDQRN